MFSVLNKGCHHPDSRAKQLHTCILLHDLGHVVTFFRPQKPLQCKIMTFGLIDIGLHYGNKGLKRQLITTVLDIKYEISRWRRASGSLS